MFDELVGLGYQIEMRHHAEAILRHDMPEAAGDIESALAGVSLPIEEVIRGGGGEGAMTQRLRHRLTDDHRWLKHKFQIERIIDGIQAECITHEIDHVKTFGDWTAALEIEWNNKDPFFDRDLENFKRLHADGAISIGCIITRGETLHGRMREMVETFAKREGFTSVDDLADYYSPTPRQREIIERAAERDGNFAAGWARVFVADKFAESTTHWRKLQDRVQRGVGNPCPLLLIGIPDRVVRT